jgi:hypothetical protein
VGADGHIGMGSRADRTSVLSLSINRAGYAVPAQQPLSANPFATRVGASFSTAGLGPASTNLPPLVNL